jgi:hypothetical protein
LLAIEPDPEVASALEACSSLDQFSRWISDLSGETEASIRGRPQLIVSRYVSAEGSVTAEEYLREQFHRMGFLVERQPGYPEASDNLIARLPGTTKPDQVVIVCAHYDSISENPMGRVPGADDNASGAAAVLTAASILRNFRFQRTVEFCLFTAEELGMLGSIMYAQECQAAGKNVVDVVNMDMIIHPRNDTQPRLPLDVDIITNSASGKLADSVRASIERYTGLDAQVTINPVAGSDHAPFWDIGARAVAVTENTPDEIWGGSTTVYHTTNDLITQPNVDLPFGLSVAKGVAVAGMKLAAWEASSALPFGATTYAEVDGTAQSDAGEHRALISASEGLLPDGAVAECHAENLVLQAVAGAWAGRPHEAVCHSRSFETFVPRSSSLPDGQEVSVELMVQGSGEFTVEGKLPSLYADCRVEVWARSIESRRLFDGAVSLSSRGIEIGGDFSANAFSLSDEKTRKEAVLNRWSEVIAFPGKIGQPITLCARLSQMAYAATGGSAECRWTEPLRLSVASTTSDVRLEVSGFSEYPQVASISADGTNVTLAWQPFSQGPYIVEQSGDLIVWTPVATTPFTTWQTEDSISRLSFFRVRAE